MFKPGDEVTTVPQLFWHGEDIGDRLGRVISNKGHVLVDLYEYDDNPVKCFTYELEHALLSAPDDITDEDIEDLFKDMQIP